MQVSVSGFYSGIILLIMIAAINDWSRYVIYVMLLFSWHCPLSVNYVDVWMLNVCISEVEDSSIAEYAKTNWITNSLLNTRLVCFSFPFLSLAITDWSTNPYSIHSGKWGFYAVTVTMFLCAYG